MLWDRSPAGLIRGIGFEQAIKMLAGFVEAMKVAAGSPPRFECDQATARHSIHVVRVDAHADCQP